MSISVCKREGPSLSGIDIEGLGLLTKEEALSLAADIVFLVDGNIIAASSNRGVEAWNTESRFHQEYARKFVEHA